jgi:hypothetical protein
MDDEDKKYRISVWYGDKNPNVLTIQQWLNDVQKAKGKFNSLNCSHSQL